MIKEVNNMRKTKIILASSSPRRKEIADQMGLEYEIIPSNYEEDMTMRLEPKDLVKTLALGKAKEVANRQEEETEAIVIGIDTFITYNKKLLGKPKSVNEAREMLKMISGKIIKAYTGVAIIDIKNKNEMIDYDITEIILANLTDTEIDNYINTGEPLDKAGAIGIQGLGSIFIKKINGCFSGAVGLPENKIYNMIAKMGVDIFNFKKWKKQI
ncbi:MAG: septum formation inhibitor Maf [Nanoarchaeota archaeon]|nr:septum formation inhibitor Maf [Nanoarchaeota archaeon]